MPENTSFDRNEAIDTLLSDILARRLEESNRLSQQRNRDLRIIESFNRNPKAFNKDEKMRIAYAARGYGVPIHSAIKADKATDGQKALAIGVGALDGLLFGLLKDSWYTSDQTKGWSDAGKLIGTVGSLFLPGIGPIGNAGKGGKAAISGLWNGSKALGLAKIGSATAKGAKVTKAVKAANAAKQASASAKALNAIKAASAADYVMAAGRLAQGIDYGIRRPIEPGLEDRRPDYANERKLLQWYLDEYGVSSLNGEE